MKIYIFLLLIIISTNSLSQTINIKGYFFLRESQIDYFTGKYVPGEKDPNFNGMQIPAPPPSSGSYMDTVVDKTKLIYKTETIEGYKVYYSIETADTLKKGAIIGSCHFLSSALIFDNDSVLIAPVFKLSELYGLKFSDFKYYIPPIVKTSDTISIIDGKKKMLLYNFKKVTLLINGKEYTNCLNIQITERWPNAIYSGTVWLSKKYGVLKWMRTTRRIETRDL